MRFLIGLALLFPGLAQARLVSAEHRRELIKRARVLLPSDVASKDMLHGPDGPGSYKAGEEVPCRYEEKDPKRPLGGHSRKFPCWDAGGQRLKIKYGADNTEVFAEAAATRLFWALGFPAERVYSVKVVCDNCPADPWASDQTPRAKRTFAPATIQKKLAGTDVSEVEDEGWEFGELGLIDERLGGSPKADVDALKLLAAFVNHGDNTANQQRLLCAEDDPACKAPLMFVTDLGGTFGGRDYKPHHGRWSKKKLWKDKAKCVLDFRGNDPSYRDPVISEAGRKRLADLLSLLSEKQIQDLFAGARFDKLPEGPPVKKWVKAFIRKRDQILSAQCPG